MRYIRQFTRKQERNQTKTIEQQKHDLDLARKVLTAVTAFSFIGNPFAAMAASTVTRVPGASGEIKFDNNVANIYAEQMKGDTAVNRFQDFKIDAGDIANMYFQSTALQGTDTWAKNLVNFVNSRIDVAGTVNAIKENKIGGNLFFLSSNGMAVTNSGVINAGSLTVLTPTQDIMDLQNKLDGNWSASDFAQITDASQRMEIPLNQDGTITVAGTIHTLGDVQLYAGKHVNVSGMIQTMTGVSKLPDNIFKHTVNIGDKNVAFESDLTATNVGNGDIVLSAKSSVTDNRKGSADASIDISGKLYGHDITVSAESEASFADDGGNIEVGEIDTNKVLDKLNLGTLNADYADVSSKATVNITNGAEIKATNDVSITANSTASVDVGAAPTQNEDGTYGGFVPAAGVVVADVDNTAKVTMSGSTVESGNNVDVKANAATELKVSAADAGEDEDSGGQKAGGQESASLVHAAVAVVSNTTEAAVEMNGGTITGKGDVNVNANVNNSLDVSAQVGAPGASAMATAVAVVQSKGSATVDVTNNAAITGANVTIAAENTVDGNVINVDNGIGVPEEDPAEEQPEQGGSSVTDELKDAASQILSGDSLTDVFMNGITGKIDEATGTEDNGSGGKQNAFVKKLGNMLDLGASVAVVEESNAANVSINNAVITAGEKNSEGVLENPGKVDIHANTVVDGTSMIVTGHANKQTNTAKKKGSSGSGAAANTGNIIADAAVLYNKIDNDAAVEINGAAISGSSVDINSSAQMRYNIRKMYDDLKDSVDALKDALGDAWDDTNDFFKQLDELVQKTGEAVTAVETEGKDDAVVEQLFNKTVTALQTIAENADAVTDNASAIVDDVKGAKEAFDSVKENLETFKDTNNYVNYYVHTESTDGIENSAAGGKAGGFELGIAGSVNVTNVNNTAATGIGAGTTIMTNDANIASNTQTETISITGNAVELMGSKKKKKPSGGAGSTTGNSSSANVGVGASVAVQDITGNSVVMVGEGVNISGLNNGAAKTITIASKNVMGQQGIVYGAGISGGKSGSGAGSGSGNIGVELQGMVNLMNGGSDSVVSIDDNVNLTGRTVNLTADNDSLITAVTGGATLGNENTAASVGASVGMVNYDVNNIVVVGDNGNGNSTESGEKSTKEKTADDKRKEGTELAKNLIKNAGITIAANPSGTTAEKGTITASELNVKANTSGLITNLAVEAAANTKSKNKKQNSALTNLTNLTGSNNAANGLIGENGQVNQHLDAGDASANTAVNTGNTTSGGAMGTGTASSGTTTLAAAGGSNTSTKNSVNVAGAGSVAINLLDGETGAFVDNVDIKMQEEGSVTVGANDSLFDGALAGAAAINWFTAKNSGGSNTPNIPANAAGGSSGNNTEVSVGGAAGVSKLDRNVSSVISNSTITNAGSIENTATKSGAELATGLGLAVAGSSDTSGTNVAVGAAVSYNEADSDIHALLINNMVKHEEGTEGKTNITNKATNKDLQIAGGISVGVAKGGKNGVGVGGTAVISDIDSNLQSGVIGGTYEDVGDMKVTATVATTQISAGVAGAAAVGNGSTSAAFGGAVNYSTIDNTNRAFIDKATITADGSVAVSAGDTNSETSDFASLVEDHGIDASGNTGTEWADKGYEDKENGVDFSNEDNTGSTIVNVATAVGISTGASSGSGAAAVNVSQVTNDMSADITGATITAGSVAGTADTNTNLVTVSAGIGASGGKFGGAGSVSWNELNNNNKVTISGSKITTGSLTETALNKADIVNVAGQLSGSASGVGVGASMAYNDMNNTTGVYLNGSTVDLTDGSVGKVKLNAENEADIMAITAGATAANTVAVNAMVAVNRGSNSTEAVIGDDGKDVTINGVTSLDVSASDETEEMTIAGGITGAGTAAIGAGVAYSDVGGSSGDNDKAQQKTRAEINHASITTAGETVHVGVSVNDASKLTTIAAGGGIAGTAAVQGEAATALINKQVNAAMNDVDINADDADNTAADVDVTANSDSHILTSADVLTISDTASVGAGVAVNRIVQQTNAAVNGGVMNVNNLAVQAHGKPRIENVGVGIAAAGQGAGVAGSVSVNMIDNDVTAHIGSGANIDADGSVGVVATSDEQISNYSGMLAAAGQGAGVGISVSVNQIQGETSATVGDEGTNTTVSAKGNGDGLTTHTDISEEDINNTLISSDTVDMNTTIGRQDETRKGFIVDASSTRDMKSFLINIGAAGQGAGVAPTVNVNMIDGATTAGISHTVINKGVSAGDVFVNAGDYTNMSGFVGSGGIAGMGAGVGLGSDTNTVSRNVEAVVDGSDVNAKAFEIDAESMQGVSSFTVGAGVAGIGGGVAGVVTVTDLANTTKAELRNSNVTANTVDVTADHKGIVNAGNVGVGAAGIGAGVGLSVGVLKDNSETYALVSNDSTEEKSIVAAGDVSISAQNTTTVKPSISATGAGVAGVAGATSINNLNSKVVTDLANANIKSKSGSIHGTANNTFNIEAYMGSQAGGAVGVGAGVTVNTIDSTVQMNVSDSKLQAAQNVALTADETRNIQQTATNVAAGGAAIGANIAITTVGQAVENIVNEDGEVISNASDKIDEANEVYGSNADTLLNGAGDALKTAGIDEESVTPSVGAAYGGGKDSQITVNISNSDVTADGTVKAEATEHDDIDMTLGSGSAGGAALNASVGILDVHRNVGINITDGRMTANAIDVDTDITGAANLDVYQGSAGVVAGNAAVGQVSTGGASQIDIMGTKLTGSSVAIVAQDTSTTGIQAFAAANGVGALGALVAEASNDSDISVSLIDAEVDAKEDVTIQSEKANTVTAEAVNEAGGLVGGAGMGATVTDTGSSKITLENAKVKAGNTIGIDAETRSALTANINSDAGGWFAGGSVSIAQVNAGTADDRLSTTVAMKGGNTFEAAEVDMSTMSSVEQHVDMDALSISAYGAAQGNVTETGAYTDVAITQEGADIFKGASDDSTANVLFNADNTVSQTVDTSGISAAGAFATGTNISTTTSDLRTNIALAGSGKGSRIGDFKADAGSYASISNHVNGDGGAIADISSFAAKANNTYKADTDVTIGGNWNASGSFTAQALNGMDIDVLSEATRAAVVGGSGTWLRNTIDNAANVTLDNATITTEGAQSYVAQNQVDYVGEIDGSGYGGINVNATDYKDDLDFTAGVDMKNSTLTGAGDEGSITAFASTTGDIHANNNLKSAGVIPVALAFSDHAINYKNSVNVTDSTLTTSKKDQDITLAASDDTVVDLEAIADTQGGAVGAASASLTNNMVRQNTVKIGDGSKIESANDVNLYSGADADGRNSSLKINVIADAYNKTIIPVYTAPTLDNSMKQENHVEAGGEVNSVRNINAKANKGNTVLVKSAKEYNNYTGTNGNGSIASTADGTINEESDEKHDNKINVSGQYTAGIHDKLEINISGSTETTEENGVNYDQIKVDITEGAEWFNPEGKDPKDLLDVKTLELENTLLAQYTALQNALNDYKPGSKEYKNLSAEMDKLIEQMKELNFVDMKYEEGKGWYKTNTPASNVTVQGIALPDILVSGGNINMESDSLTSTNNAVLTAKGSPEITINNSSDLYLEIHDLAIVGKGGEISFNGQDLTDTNKGNYQGAWTSISPTDELPTINITSTSASSFSNNPLAQPDISVVGNLSNTEGKICVTNINHNILIGENGNVSAKNVFLTAESGSVSQTSKTGIFNVAGDPISQYQFSDKVATQVQEYLNKILLDDDPENDKLNFNSYDEYLKWLVSKVGVDPDDLGINSETATKNEVIDESAGILAGNNVYINALNVNINGLVQAGYGNYSSTLTEEANDRIKEITQNWNHTPLLDSDVIGQEKYLVNAGGKRWNDETKVWDYEVGIYYNPATQKLLVDKVSPDGGQIYINGAVSSTGSNGRLMAMDGAADIQIDTTVVKGDAVQGIVMNEIANKNIEGLISITDMNKTTDSKGNAVDGLVTEYKNGSWREYEYGTSIIDRPEFINVDNDSNSNVEYTYQPESGLRYEYTGGYKAGEENHYSYKDYFIAWGWIDYSTSSEELDKIAQEGKADVETSTTNGDELANGVYIGKGTTGGDNSKDWYITGSAQRGEEVPVGKPTDHKEWGMHEDDSKKDPDWVGKMFGYGSIVYQWITENTTSTTTTSSIKADKPITIGFVGGKANEGKIDIRGNQNIELAGNISNAEVNGEGKGYVSISSGTGSIIAGSNANILSDDVRLDAATGIDVTHSAIGDAAHVALSTDSGDIRFESYHGDITVEQAVTGGANPITAETGNVYLEAAGSILDGHTSGNYAVKGQRIDLVSTGGSIGTKDKAFTVLGGSELYSSDTMASSVNASAAGDIVLTQTSGNMRLGTIESTNGDAVLTVTKGSFVDAHPSENSSSSSAQDKIDRWLESGLINAKDEAGDNTEAAKASKKERVDALTAQANSLAGGDEAKVESYWAAADAFYNDEGVNHAKETYLKAVAEAGGDKEKINAAYEQYQKDYKNAKTKHFENKEFSDGEQDLITSYAEVSNSENYGWSKNELLYAIQDSVLNTKPGEVQTVDMPNVTANNITLNAANGGIGIDGEAQFISNDALNDVENLKILAAAKAGDLTWSDDGVTVRQQQAITVQVKDKGQVNVTGRDNVYLAGVEGTMLDINDIKTTGDIRLQGDAGVDVDLLKGQDLTIVGGAGNITSSSNEGGYIYTDLTGSIDANADGTISFESVNDSDLKILTAATNKDLNLKAAGNILMQNAEGSTAQGRLNANVINLEAGGTIGTSDTAIRILDNGAVVNADATGGIWISGESGDGSTGNLVIGNINGGSFDLTSVSNVSLGRTDDPNTDENEALTGSIKTTQDDASISAVNVDLADGTVNVGTNDFNVIATNGDITQSEASKGLIANHVNLSSTGSQLLLSEKNNINSVTVKGLTDDSLTGNVEIHSAADSFGVQFGDKNGDTAAGITVNDGSIVIQHNGSADGKLTVTGSATTQKANGSDVNADISFSGKQSAIDVKGTMNAGDNFSATTESGAINITGTVTAHNGEVKATTNSGAISFDGDVTAMRGDVTAATGSGDVTFDGSAVAKTDILLESGSGAITVNGIATAGNQFKADTVDGKITLGGDVTATAGSVNAHTTAGDIEVKGDVDAGTDIDLGSGNGAITVTGSATAGNNFSAKTGSGSITLGDTLESKVTAETGKVLAQTQSGTVLVNGSIQSAFNTELQAGITADDRGNITVNGNIASGEEVVATVANGDIVFEGTTTASDGDVKAEVTGDGSITFNGAVTANSNGEGGGNIVANVSGEGNITTESDAVFNADKDVLFTTNVGNITANSAVTAGEDIIFKVLTEGDMTLRDDLKSEQNIDLNVNSGNILFEGTQDGVHEDIYVTSNGGDVTVSINEGGKGDIKDTNGKGADGDWANIRAEEGNVTVKHDGVGDVDLYELYAKKDAGVSVADGNLHLVDVSGNLVAIFVKSEGKEMDVENIEAAQQIAISGSNMDLDSITQREDGDGFLVITPEGTADDQPIDNLVIGDILTNGGVRFDHLWLNTGNIHVSEGALHLDKVYVQDKATFSTDDMTTNVFGSAPVYDDSVSSSYWVNTSINSPKDDLAAWNSDELNDKWMHIFFSPEGTVQISNGNLLHLADHNYAYNQRYSQVDWMNLFTDEDFYNFYDKYYAPDLSYHERYGLTSGSGHSVENAEEDEVIVE
ncbi:hypothetical protein [Megasphaera sp. An286]|uniref:hypothetical protein n=1 Tax=Megasphaera sp. An286 TaxID=1965622 RepID=UPI000B3BCE1D|nr:hypothetical protein [Megasphaera sp. An286]OUO48039.1 hypothetical protein B5F80_02810 [Megasphaera sp. An286]